MPLVLCHRPSSLLCWFKPLQWTVSFACRFTWMSVPKQTCFNILPPVLLRYGQSSWGPNASSQQVYRRVHVPGSSPQTLPEVGRDSHLRVSREAVLGDIVHFSIESSSPIFVTSQAQPLCSFIPKSWANLPASWAFSQTLLLGNPN